MLSRKAVNPQEWISHFLVNQWEYIEDILWKESVRSSWDSPNIPTYLKMLHKGGDSLQPPYVTRLVKIFFLTFNFSVGRSSEDKLL